MITDAVFYAIAIPAVLLSGISKGGLSGLGALSVPMLALVISPAQAAGLMLPILCLMDLFGLWAYRTTWSRSQMRVLLPGSLLGIGIGVLAFGHLNDNAVRVLIGLIAVLFSINQWLKPLLQRQLAEAPPPSSAKGLFWSGMAGFTSFVAHAGGPPINAYVLPMRLVPVVFSATMGAFFFAINLSKWIPYAWLGLLDLRNMATSLVLLPLAPLGVWIGVRMAHRIRPQLFYRLIYAGMFLTGCKLVWDGFVT